MISAESQKVIEDLVPDINRSIVLDFFSRMDEDYFTTFSPEEIASHIRMSSGLNAGHRVEARITRRSPGREFEIVIVGFDYLSEFAIFCGLLSSYGLDIQSGNIFSFARQAAQPKVVDVFSVALKSGEDFDEARQREFQSDLLELAQLLAAGSVDDARERVNRSLTERIESLNEPLKELQFPVEIDFDNESSRDWTVMETRSQDAFAFLYSVSNALAMRGIYIHKVKIRSAGNKVRDQFYIADLWGRKIEDLPEQERLRVAVGMIKQFTRFLPEAPDPAKAMRHFDQFLDKIGEEEFPDHAISFLSHEKGMTLMAELLGSSDFLWDDFLRIHFNDFLPVLEQLSEARPPAPAAEYVMRDIEAVIGRQQTFEEKKAAINRFKDQRLFLIDVQHLLRPRETLIEFSRAVTDLADAVVREAGRICGQAFSADANKGAFAICGLGKFGGREMGYASDLELLFVHEGVSDRFEMLARRVIECIESRREGIFHVDLRLRPYGDAGAWSIPFEEFQNYYRPGGAAAPFERQALVKLRWIAGDPGLGRRVEIHRDRFSYNGIPWDSTDALHLRRRQMHELVKPGQINVKYSAGGIIDIEYAVQYLQIIHGGTHRELRVTETLEALHQLRLLEIIPEKEYEMLNTAYLFHRGVIDALRIVRGDSSDLVLPDPGSEEFKSLARRLGYRGRNRREAAAQLSSDIQEWMNTVHDFYVGRFAS